MIEELYAVAKRAAPRLSLQAFVKPVILVSVLLLSAWAGRQASTRMLMMLVGGMGAIVLLQKPPLGLVGLIVASFTVPFEIGTGTQTSINITLLLVPALLGLWLLDMLRRRALCLVPSRTTAPLLAFIGAATVSLIAGNALWDYYVPIAGNRLFVQLGQWSVFVFSAGAFLLVANLITDLKWLRALTYTFIACGVLFTLGSLLPLLRTMVSHIAISKATGSLFWAWLAALLYGQLLFNQRLRWLWRLLFLATLAAIFYISWFLGYIWVSGWLPPAIALFIITWLRSRKLGLALTIILVILIVAQFTYFYNRTWVEARMTGSFNRFQAWQEVLDLVRDNLLLGLGPSNYWHYYRAYHHYGYGFFNPKVNSHNNYVDIIAQTGLIGFGLFLWFIAEVGWLGLRLRDRFEDSFARGYVNACLGGLAATLAACMLGDWFLPFVYNIGLAGFRASVFGWLFLGGLVSLEAISRAKTGEME